MSNLKNRPSSTCQDCGAPVPSQSSTCPRCILGMSLNETSAGGTSSFGDYEILGELGRGGMGAVYQARQVSLDRMVALKTIRPGATLSPSARMRFRMEAEAIAGLDHPGIIPVYESGEHDEQLFYSMRYLKGGTLSALIHQEKRDVRSLVAIVIKVAEAVAHAHAHGILHRDLKPSNILLDEQGEPQLSDFGLVKHVSEDQHTSALTLTTDVVGSPNYMAPEQAQGSHLGKLTTAVDVYGLGAILYEVLTRRPPFIGGSPLDTIRQVVDRDPKRPRETVPDADADLEAVCLKCLEKDPQKRYGSAQAFADELERWQRGLPVSVRRIGVSQRAWRWCRRRPVTAGLLAALALTLVAASILVIRSGINLKHANEKTQILLTTSQLQEVESQFERGQSEQALAVLARLTRAHPENGAIRQRLASALGYGVFPTEASEAQSVQRGATLLDSHLNAAGEVLSITDDGVLSCAREGDNGHAEILFKMDIEVSAAAISNDGQTVAIGDTDGLVHVANLQGQLQCEPLAHDKPVVSIQFNPDDRLMACALASETEKSGFLGGDYRKGDWVHIWNISNSERVLEPLRVAENQTLSLAFSPDSRYFAAGSNQQGVGLWDLETGERVRLIPNGEALHLLAFSRDGSRLAGGSLGGRVYAWDLAVDGHEKTWDFYHGLRVNGLFFMRERHRLVSYGAHGKVKFWDLDRGNHGPVLNHDGFVRDACLSADESLIATACHDNTARVWNADTGAPVTERIGHDSGPRRVWISESNRQLVTQTYGRNVFRWRLRGATLERTHHLPSLPPPDELSGLALTPDGTRLLVGSVGSISCLAIHQDTLPERTHEFPFDTGVSTIKVSGSGEVAAFATGKGMAGFMDLSQQPMTPTEIPRKNPETYIDDISVSHSASALITITRPSPTLSHWAVGQEKRLAFVRQDHVMSDITRLRGSAIFPNHQRAVYGLGSKLVIWDLKNGTELSWHVGVHDAPINHSGFSADGRWLVTTSVDKTAVIWRVDGLGAVSVHKVLRHDSAVDQAAFSPSGEQVVTCSRAGYVRVWDVATGMPVTGKMPHTGKLLCARIVGNRVVSASAEGTVKEWPLPQVPENWNEPLAQLAEFIAGRTVDQTGRATFLSGAEKEERWDSLKRWHEEQDEDRIPKVIDAYLSE